MLECCRTAWPRYTINIYDFSPSFSLSSTSFLLAHSATLSIWLPIYAVWRSDHSSEAKSWSTFLIYCESKRGAIIICKLQPQIVMMMIIWSACGSKSLTHFLRFSIGFRFCFVFSCVLAPLSQLLELNMRRQEVIIYERLYCSANGCGATSDKFALNFFFCSVCPICY